MFPGGMTLDEGPAKHQEFLVSHLSRHFSLSTFHDVTLFCDDGEVRWNRIYLHLLLAEFPLDLSTSHTEQQWQIILPGLTVAHLLDRGHWLQISTSDKSHALIQEQQQEQQQQQQQEQEQCSQKPVKEGLPVSASDVKQISLCEEKEERDFEGTNTSDEFTADIGLLPVMKCSVCGKEFKSRGGLHAHMNIHSKQHKCRFCEEVYARKDYLRKHEYSEHSYQIEDSSEPTLLVGQKSLVQCDICSRIFRAKSQLEIHKRKHTGEKPFECSSCPTRFTTHWNLKAHQKKHTNAAEFACEVCGKHLSTANALKDHLTIHTGERPNKCIQCGISFKRSTNLWRHRNKYHSVTTSKTLPIDHVLDISVVDSDIFNMNGLNVDNYEVIVDNQPYLS